jgi:FkbM family methyltransferase
MVLRKARHRLDVLRLARHLSLESRVDLVRVGTEYGGYVLPQDLPRANWTCYCGGIGEDASFELELIRRYGCTVIGFDPTPRSTEYVREIVAEAPEFRFVPVGLWSSDTEQRFYAPSDPEHVSHSITERGRAHREHFTAQCRSVPSLMAELGHDRVDLLKLDVEGAEYEVLESVLDADVRLQILLVEFHRTGSRHRMTSMVDRLQTTGYRPVHLDGNDVTFVDATLV